MSCFVQHDLKYEALALCPDHDVQFQEDVEMVTRDNEIHKSLRMDHTDHIEHTHIANTDDYYYYFFLFMFSYLLFYIFIWYLYSLNFINKIIYF